ncbi:MAG: thiamine phosphate synthase [Spirochaetae bacterium HGW-Spirochaetae-6]|jgi:thiamine-phosphate pyrophosphorylase|nr:MAG: thiamine phosphate synthase [Spirochaetae bacterium HGW-Spirochaetae-6]
MVMWQIIDANFNRCREGLRVLDDLLRFYYGWSDFEKIKNLRHRLKNVEKQYAGLCLSFRGAQRDPGQRLFAEEIEREDPRDILVANFKRVQESLRSLEECFKLVENAQEALANLKSCRFEAYVLEQDILTKLDKKLNLSLYLVTDSRLNALPLEDVVERAILGGVSMVQLREKHLCDKDIMVLGKKVLSKTRAGGVPLLIDDRVDLCLALGADGVHLGQSDLCIKSARKMLGATKIIGKSTHSLSQVQEALGEELDYIAFGPLFATPTKNYEPLGLKQIETVKAMAREAGIPVVFIGGITRETLSQVMAHNPPAVAVVREIMASGDPREAAAEICQALKKTKKG